jgi:hypothetical protein
MGSGKTSWVRERTRRARRVLVWDGKGIDWGAREGFEVVTSLAQLQSRIMQPGPMRLSVRVVVSRDNFKVFCRLAWVWARFRPGVLIVDEISDVTTPGKAPDAWGEICRKVRAFGSDVYVTTQRPQECDKTAQGNAMIFHCGWQSDSADQAYVAKRLLGGMVPYERMASLGALEFLERDVRTRTVTEGRRGGIKRALATARL